MLREWMSIVEGIKAYDAYRDQTVMIHRNPNPATLARLFQRFPGGLRGIIGERGLFVWDAELLHDDAAEQAGLTGYYLYLLPKVVQIKGEDYFEENLAVND